MESIETFESCPTHPYPSLIDISKEDVLTRASKTDSHSLQDQIKFKFEHNSDQTAHSSDSKSVNQETENHFNTHPSPLLSPSFVSSFFDHPSHSQLLHKNPKDSSSHNVKRSEYLDQINSTSDLND